MDTNQYLNKLTSEELSELKEKLYRENKTKMETITQITRLLGDSPIIGYGPKYNLTVVSKNNDIKSYVDDYGHYTTVHVNGKLVMSTHNEKLFIPGKWLKSFMDMTVVAAEEKEQAKKREAEESKRRELIDELSYTWND